MISAHTHVTATVLNSTESAGRSRAGQEVTRRDNRRSRPVARDPPSARFHVQSLPCCLQLRSRNSALFARTSARARECPLAGANSARGPVLYAASCSCVRFHQVALGSLPTVAVQLFTLPRLAGCQRQGIEKQWDWGWIPPWCGTVVICPVAAYAPGAAASAAPVVPPPMTSAVRAVAISVEMDRVRMSGCPSRMGRLFRPGDARVRHLKAWEAEGVLPLSPAGRAWVDVHTLR